MVLKGKAWKFGDDISTDLITPGKYYHLRSNMPELARHVMEDADPTFAQKVAPGDIIVGGTNFGMGSSREHAPLAVKIAGISAVVAKSFARIFFRNSINIGLPLVIMDTDKVDAGDQLEIDLESGTVKDVTKGISIQTGKMSPEIVGILNEGGLVPYVKKYGGLKVARK
jgi:3-isopropylmalate/(R)-2-methylmalate dehydratase small subunit